MLGLETSNIGMPAAHEIVHINLGVQCHPFFFQLEIQNYYPENLTARENIISEEKVTVLFVECLKLI